VNRGKVGIIAAIAGLIVLFLYFDLEKYITLSSLQSNHTMLVHYYEQHKLATIAIFIIIYIIQAALFLPGAAVLMLASGAVFGAVLGTLYVNIGATIGAAVAFLVGRYLLHDVIQRRFGSRLKKINIELETKGFNYLLFLRLIPIFPFFLINFGASLTRMPLRTFILATMVGMVPPSFVYCNAGASLATIKNMSEVLSPRVIVAFALLGIFALIPVIYYRIKK
jgi:uncharacterized membrane protein YdjX (TVP38/TMEM64 family)